MKIQISINDSLLQEVDSFAKSQYMSRSALIAASLNAYLNSQKAAATLAALQEVLAKVSQKPDISPEDLTELDEWQHVCNLVTDHLI